MARRGKSRRVLVLDVGGTHVKMRIGTRGPIREFKSGRKLSAKQMVARVLKMTADWDYEVISIGFPGVVVHGKIAAEPANLGTGWIGFDFGKAFSRPVRIINDAALQAVGSYRGGHMLFLGLGTGLGVTLILDGVVEPMEIGHMPYKHGRSYEDYVGERGYRRLGTKKWRKVVAQVIEQLSAVLEADYVVLGGGNVRKLKTLPKKVHRGDKRNARPVYRGSNENAFVGGVRLWEQSAQNMLVLRGHGRPG
jgi:predicted NBD/HSP70 family sugar kinase